MKLYINEKGFNFNDPLDFDSDFTRRMFRNRDMFLILINITPKPFDISNRIILKL